MEFFGMLDGKLRPFGLGQTIGFKFCHAQSLLNKF